MLTTLLVVAGCSSKSSHSQSGGAGGQATGGASGMGGGQAGSAGSGGVGGCPSWCGGGECTSGVCELAPNEAAADFLSQDDEYLYWTESTKVRRIPKDRSTGTQSIADLGPGSTLEGCAVDATDIYFAVKNHGLVYRAKKDGSELHTALFASGPAGPVDVAIDAQHVYWTNTNQGTVERVSKTSGPTETIASNLPGLWALAVDDSAVYLATDQALFSCAKKVGCVPKELANGSATTGWRADPKLRLGNSSVFLTASQQVLGVPLGGGNPDQARTDPGALGRFGRPRRLRLLGNHEWRHVETCQFERRHRHGCEPAAVCRAHRGGRSFRILAQATPGGGQRVSTPQDSSSGAVTPSLELIPWYPSVSLHPSSLGRPPPAVRSARCRERRPGPLDTPGESAGIHGVLP